MIPLESNVVRQLNKRREREREGESAMEEGRKLGELQTNMTAVTRDIAATYEMCAL